MDETRNYETNLPESIRQQFVVVVGMFLSHSKEIFLAESMVSDYERTLKALNIKHSLLVCYMGADMAASGDWGSEIDWPDVCETVRAFFYKDILPADWVDFDCDCDTDEERAIHSIQLLLMWLLHHSEKCERSRILYKAKLGELFNINPAILTEGGNFLNIYCRYPFYWKDIRNESFDIAIFETIFELGMSHCPTELGFVFHNTTFTYASKLFGTKKVVQIINDKLFSTLGQNSNETLKAMVFAAASNDKISLDGVYTLLRHNPSIKK